MQARSVWTPPLGTLGRIVAESRARASLLHATAAELGRRAAATPRGPSLASALQEANVAVIAEVKRRSPSKGSIAPGLSAAARAAAYARGGAAGISVLTEPEHFDGSLDDLVAVRTGVPLPVLRKDFLVDRLQLLEAAAAGASAVLLIARALDPGTLQQLASDARALGLETLIEVRSAVELERALAARADVIGVNNRDLETLEIDPEASLRLIPQVPPGIPAVAESGMRRVEDVEGAAAAGADAVLVGSSISASDDPERAVRALAGVPRRRRGA